MSPEARDVVVLVTTLVAAGACARYYVLAVLDEDRLLSRAAALAVAVFGVMAVAFLVRVLT